MEGSVYRGGGQILCKKKGGNSKQMDKNRKIMQKTRKKGRKN